MEIETLIEKWGKYANDIYESVFYNDYSVEEYLEKDEEGNYYQNGFIPDDKEFAKIVKLSYKLKEKLKNDIYVDDNTPYLELSDSHTLWDITHNIDDMDEYYYTVGEALKTLSSIADTEVYALGRSGRHICVENTIFNALNFEKLCVEQQRLERDIINQF